MVAYTKDNALVAKYPPRADKQASSSTGGKASANVAMPAKHPPGSGPARSRPQSLYQRGDKRANGGKTSVKNFTGGQATAGEEANTPTTAKHPQHGRALTLLAVRHLPERPTTTAAKYCYK
jgi:hypothetical protein